MRKLILMLGFLVFSAGLATGVYDGLHWEWRDGLFPFAPIGEIWASLHRDSLLLLQPAVERYISPALWSGAIFPALTWPATPVLLGAGALLFLLPGKKRRPQRKAADIADA